MSILKLYRRHFYWKFIGYRLCSIYNNNVPILYYMTDSGRRRIKLPYIHDSTERKKLNQIAIFDRVWENGGPFPKDFLPEADTLGAMLRRMVDEKLIRED